MRFVKSGEALFWRSSIKGVHLSKIGHKNCEPNVLC